MAILKQVCLATGSVSTTTTSFPREKPRILCQGHAATINDMILMEHNEALLVISCGDDGTIKVWL
jgi:hypothetical protein